MSGEDAIIGSAAAEREPACLGSREGMQCVPARCDVQYAVNVHRTQHWPRLDAVTQ
jgi:hypothetical protein